MAMSVRPSKNSAMMRAHSGTPLAVDASLIAPWQEFSNGGPTIVHLLMLLGDLNAFTFSQALWHCIGGVEAHSGVPTALDV